jgi:hypothetical protein
MTNQETNSQNYFQTALTATVSDSATSFPVSSIGSLTTPCWLVVDPDSVTNREVILFDGVFGASAFVTSDVSNRDQAGTADGGAKEHAIGVKVESRPLQQHIADLNDRVDFASDHDNLTGLADDDHTQYLNTARHDVTTRHPVSVLGDGSGLGLRQTVEIKTDDTFDKGDYPWLRAVMVYAQGGGGGGGGAAATGAGELSIGGGGRGGSFGRRMIAVATLPASVTVTIGAGGVGGSGSNGGVGGSTTFGSLLTAPGGGGGDKQGPTTILQTAQAGDAGTVSSTGDINTAGGAGGPGIGVYAASTNGVQGGQGGDSFFGSGGGSINSGAGNDGVLFGGGGGGAARKESLSAADGGDGASGIVVVELYA